jgi:hypothetical protein
MIQLSAFKYYGFYIHKNISEIFQRTNAQSEAIKCEAIHNDCNQ